MGTIYRKGELVWQVSGLLDPIQELRAYRPCNLLLLPKYGQREQIGNLTSATVKTIAVSLHDSLTTHEISSTIWHPASIYRQPIADCTATISMSDAKRDVHDNKRVNKWSLNCLVTLIVHRQLPLFVTRLITNHLALTLFVKPFVISRLRVAAQIWALLYSTPTLVPTNWQCIQTVTSKCG